MHNPSNLRPGALCRRAWMQRVSLAGLALGWEWAQATGRATAAAPPVRKMRSALTPGSIGVRANQSESIRLAIKHGFEAVEPNAGYLGGLADDVLKALREELTKNNLSWAAAGFPLQFRGDEAAFEQSLKELPKTAAALQRAGVERMGTWISPTHATLDRAANLKQHASRLRAGARILRDHGLRLGLEYVGTRTSRAGNRPVFIYNLAGLKELLAEIGLDNVGVILDSWHWWQAGETAADLVTLKNAQVISVDLNDAPAGIAIDQQKDGQRELPMATGVIDTAAFINALKQIGYDGPIRAEPFNKVLNDMEDEAACAVVSAAIKKAFALIK